MKEEKTGRLELKRSFFEQKLISSSITNNSWERLVEKRRNTIDFGATKRKM